MADPGRVAPELRLCRGCRQYVWEGPAGCHFCGADVAALKADYEARQAAVREAADALRAAVEAALASRDGDVSAPGSACGEPAPVSLTPTEPDHRERMPSTLTGGRSGALTRPF